MTPPSPPSQGPPPGSVGGGLLVFAWLFVGIPLVWGVTQTLSQGDGAFPLTAPRKSSQTRDGASRRIGVSSRQTSPSMKEPASILDPVYKVLEYPIPIGTLHLTLGGIIQLAVLFALVVLGEQLLWRKATMRVLRRMHIDAGLQYAIARISGYIVITFGFYLALNAVGVSLNSLAVVAGAIGIGIGFGLQNIIQNFISGLIILTERPIAIGDRVEVGGIAGTVAKIELRSTEIVSHRQHRHHRAEFELHHQPGDQLEPRRSARADPDSVRGGLRHRSGAAQAGGARGGRGNAPTRSRTRRAGFSLWRSAIAPSTSSWGVWTRTQTQSPRTFISDLNFGLERKLRENEIEIPYPRRDLIIREKISRRP